VGELAQLVPVRSDGEDLWPVITDIGMESDQAVPAREGGGRVGRKREGRQGREDQGRKDHGSTTGSVHGVLLSSQPRKLPVDA
jgi:hypothetical protein